MSGGNETSMKRVFDALGWVGVLLVVAAVLIRFTRPELETWWWRLAMAGLVVVLLYLATQWREFLALWHQRSARAGTLSSASVLLLLAILIGVNYVATRQHKRWDLTAGGQFTLSDQTRKVLASLDAPVTVKVFARDTEFQRFRDRFDGYTYVSDKLQVEYIDPDKQPALARQWEIQQYGTIAIERDGRIERITTDTEQDITNAIVRAVEGGEKKIYFVQGHGERDTASADERTGYNAIAGALQRDNFAVERLVLAQQQRVPEDASVLVIAGPTTDYLEPELAMLRAYLEQGGKLVMLLDPPTRADAAPLTGLVALAREWGIEVGTNVVVDVSGVGQLLGAGPSVPVVATYPEHPITQNFGLLTAFPLARSVAPVSGDAGGRTARTFAETSERSWAETDLAAVFEGRPVARDEAAGDLGGPISLAAAVSVDAPAAPAQPTPAADAAAAKEDADADADPDPQAPRPQTRVVVIGDSDFASNSMLGTQGNQDLFLNAANWAAQQENLIAIRPRDPEDRRVTMTVDQQARVGYVSALILPAAILALGVFTWYRRRG
jgi:ABC-type uncharacterized transport system involved in gliding motility auxiliary subunit